ncbi:MAG: DUF3843 family protein [Bacteroidales bacterium]|jgi:hypothetical protein|nr:DUF3843 family protein [Bacteroidales bacterium]
MKKLKNPSSFSVVSFRELHPLGTASGSDFYYTGIANRILRTLTNDKVLINSFKPYSLRKAALHSAAYFEDVISQLGLFSAFRNIHQKLCGSKLPFFSLKDEDYIDEEINQEDVRLLLWCIKQEEINERSEDNDEITFLNPMNPIFGYVSTLILDILDEEYETAPENEALHTLLHDTLFENHFHLREILKWLHYDSYLSMQYPKNSLEKEKQSARKSNTEMYRENVKAFSYVIEVERIYNNVCSPVAIKAVEWLKEITSNEHLKITLDALEVLPYSVYKMLHKFDNKVEICPFDNENQIMYLDVDSMSETDKLETDQLFMASLVRFNDLWCVNGVALFMSETDYVKKDQDKSSADKIRFIYEKIMEYTKQKPLLFFKNFDEYVDFRNNIFSNMQDIDESETDNFFKSKMNLVLFTDVEEGTAILQDAARWIKSPDNKLYDKDEAEDGALSILVGLAPAPLSLISYLVEKDLLPDAAINSLYGKEYGRQLVQNNKWFIVRFFQPYLFHGNKIKFHGNKIKPSA